MDALLQLSFFIHIVELYNHYLNYTIVTTGPN